MILQYSRILKALRYSFQGIKLAYKHEAAFRDELLLLCAAVPSAVLLSTSIAEFCLLIASVLCILCVELLNSAIEAVVDLASPEKHELAGRAKDMGSAAVLIACASTALLWMYVILK